MSTSGRYRVWARGHFDLPEIDEVTDDHRLGEGYYFRSIEVLEPDEPERDDRSEE